MNPKNLQRAKEIAEQLPALEEARSILSDTEAARICVGKNTMDVELPTSVNFNILGVINAEINKLKEETKEL